MAIEGSGAISVVPSSRSSFRCRWHALRRRVCHVVRHKRRRRGKNAADEVKEDLEEEETGWAPAKASL